MICGNCNTVNDSNNVFCVNCGNAVTGGSGASSGINISTPTIPTLNPNQPKSRGYSLADSTETAVVNLGHSNAPNQPFAPVMPFSGELRSKKSSPLLWVGGALIILIGFLAMGIFIIGPRLGNGEVLPDHLGMFMQSKNRDRVDEIRKQDNASAIEAKNSFLKSDTLPVVDAQPNLILYADGKDIPINDVRLIQLDTIKDDGSMKQLDFQAAPVDGKPEMKRIRVPDSLATGKYAFAVFDGFFNDGKHKFWAFEVKDSSKSDNGDALKAASVSVKPAAPSQPAAPRIQAPSAPAGPPPSIGNYAYSTTGNLILRSGPGQSYPKIRNLYKGEQVTILGYSDNTENFKGRSAPFVQVRTANGQTGWAFAAYLR